MFVTKKTFNKFVDNQAEMWELMAAVTANNIIARSAIVKDAEELREDVDYLLESLEEYLD